MKPRALVSILSALFILSENVCISTAEQNLNFTYVPDHFEITPGSQPIGPCHGGAVIDFNGNISRGHAGYGASYMAQRDHKMAQFEKMISWCQSAGCRMLCHRRWNASD